MCPMRARALARWRLLARYTSRFAHGAIEAAVMWLDVAESIALPRGLLADLVVRFDTAAALTDERVSSATSPSLLLVNLPDDTSVMAGV